MLRMWNSFFFLHHLVERNLFQDLLPTVIPVRSANAAEIDGFPNGAKTNTGALQGREHGH